MREAPFERIKRGFFVYRFDSTLELNNLIQAHAYLLKNRIRELP